MGYIYLNLDYLNKQIPNMPDEMKEILQLSLENINQIIDQIKVDLNKQDWESLKFTSHQLKSNFKILGMDDLAEIVQGIEHDAKQNQFLNTLVNRTNQVIEHWEIALQEVITEIEK